MSGERGLSGLVGLAGRESVDLEEVLRSAARLVRVDRKYLVRREVAEAFLRDLPEAFRVLSVAGRTSTSYSSVYFDTARLDACRDHVQQRRRRWKVRSRLYVEDRLCRMEVKVRDGSGLTAKTFQAIDPAAHGRIGGREATFVAETLAAQGIGVGTVAGGGLLPSMDVTYQRCTLADTGAAVRVTVDWDVWCRRDDGAVHLDPDWVLVETKGGSRPSTADRTLLALGARPRPFSKYVSATSALCSHIPDNDVRRLLGTVLHVSPSPAPGQLEEVPA